MATGLFKYFGTDEDKLKMFVNGQVSLTPPKYFNDPWDFLPRPEEPSAEALEAWYRAERIKGTVPCLSATGLSEVRSCVGKADYLHEVGIELQEEYSKVSGVVCLSKLPTNRLMWAHYGESHQGFVAEFLSNDLGEKCGYQCARTPFGLAFKVKYPPTEPVFKEDHSNILQIILSKHECWEYEQEWRVMKLLWEGIKHPTKPKHVMLTFKLNELIRVILGLRVADKVRSSLSTMLNRPEYKNVIREVAYIEPETRELKSRPSNW